MDAPSPEKRDSHDALPERPPRDAPNLAGRPERSRTEHHDDWQPARRSRSGRETNGYCWLALVATGWCVGAVLLSYILPKTHDSVLVTGLAGLSMFPAGVGALVFSILSLKPSMRQPERYWHRAGVPIALVVVSGAINAFLIFLLILVGLKPKQPREERASLQTNAVAVRPAVSSRPRAGSKGELLRFDKYGFVFHKPSGTWELRDNPTTKGAAKWLLTMLDHRGIIFAILVMPVTDDSIEERERMVNSFKADFSRRSTSSYKCEDTVTTYNGVEGHQMNIDTFVSGKEWHMCEWVFLTNKTFYRLEAKASPTRNVDLEGAATNLFLDFELETFPSANSTEQLSPR